MPKTILQKCYEKLKISSFSPNLAIRRMSVKSIGVLSHGSRDMLLHVLPILIDNEVCGLVDTLFGNNGSKAAITCVKLTEGYL